MDSSAQPWLLPKYIICHVLTTKVWVPHPGIIGCTQSCDEYCSSRLLQPWTLLPSLLLPDIEKFEGQYFRKTPEGCEAKTVLAFGLGNLELDMVMGLSPQAREKVDPSRTKGMVPAGRSVLAVPFRMS